MKKINFKSIHLAAVAVMVVLATSCHRPETDYRDGWIGEYFGIIYYKVSTFDGSGNAVSDTLSISFNVGAVLDSCYYLYDVETELFHGNNPSIIYMDAEVNHDGTVRYMNALKDNVVGFFRNDTANLCYYNSSAHGATTYYYISGTKNK